MTTDDCRTTTVQHEGEDAPSGRAGSPPLRLRRARVRFNGNVVELEKFRDPRERARREEEARHVLADGGTLDVARRRTDTDDRCGVLATLELLFPDQQWRPEEFLMLGMLERTMFDLRGSNARRREESEAWIATDDRSHVFAFASICDALGRSPDEMRAALRARRLGQGVGEDDEAWRIRRARRLATRG